METSRLEQAFDECLQRLLAGSSLEQVLTSFPELAADLRPLLQAAMAARQHAQAIRIPVEAKRRSRHHLLAAAARAELVKQEQTARQARSASLFSLPKLAFSLIVLLLVVILGGATTVAVSARSLPGDALYSLKLATEHTRLLLTADPAKKLELEDSFDKERLKEMHDLVNEARTATITFSGGVESIQPSEWLVENIPVHILPGTRLPEKAAPGFYVQVQGLLQPDGSVNASQIEARLADLSGVIEAMDGMNWTVTGHIVRLDEATQLEGQPANGLRVQIQGYRLADGGLLAFAIEVKEGSSFGNEETPTPSEAPRTPEAEDTHEATETLRPSETEEVETPEIDRTPEDEEEHEATETPNSGEATQPSKTPTPTDDEEHTPEPTRVDEQKNTVEPTRTPKPTDDD